MESGQGRSSRGRLLILVLVLVAPGGCAGGGSRVDKALRADQTPVAHSVPLEKHYQVHCPDVVDVQVGGPDPWSGLCTVGTDGRVVVDPVGPVRVDGLTTPEIGGQLAARLRLLPDQVHVQVAEYRSQHIYIFGEVAGLQRAVDYRGPETVAELLQRVGGLTAGAAPGDIQVVRTHVADGKQPEVFQIDLAAIVLKKKQETNIHVLPFDQVYVGETRQCFLSKCLPPWLQPFFESLCGMGRAKRFQTSEALVEKPTS